jgi:hypothetical protein
VQVQISTGADLSFVYSHGFTSSFGYYEKNEAGNPSSGKIIWANTRNATAEQVRNYTIA